MAVPAKAIVFVLWACFQIDNNQKFLQMVTDFVVLVVFVKM